MAIRADREYRIVEFLPRRLGSEDAPRLEPCARVHHLAILHPGAGQGERRLILARHPRVGLLSSWDVGNLAHGNPAHRRASTGPTDVPQQGRTHRGNTTSGRYLGDEIIQRGFGVLLGQMDLQIELALPRIPDAARNRREPGASRPGGQPCYQHTIEHDRLSESTLEAKRDVATCLDQANGSVTRHLQGDRRRVDGEIYRSQGGIAGPARNSSNPFARCRPGAGVRGVRRNHRERRSRNAVPLEDHQGDLDLGPLFPKCRPRQSHHLKDGGAELLWCRPVHQAARRRPREDRSHDRGRLQGMPERIPVGDGRRMPPIAPTVSSRDVLQCWGIEGDAERRIDERDIHANRFDHLQRAPQDLGREFQSERFTQRARAQAIHVRPVQNVHLGIRRDEHPADSARRVEHIDARATLARHQGGSQEVPEQAHNGFGGEELADVDLTGGSTTLQPTDHRSLGSQ